MSDPGADRVGVAVAGKAWVGKAVPGRCSEVAVDRCPTRMIGWTRDDRGSGSLLGLMICAAMVVVCAATLGIVDVHRARSDAQTAADLAALAAAKAVARGDVTHACAIATEVASRNRARVAACVVVGPVVDLSVERDLRLAAAWNLPASVTMSARAGPAP